MDRTHLYSLDKQYECIYILGVNLQCKTIGYHHNFVLETDGIIPSKRCVKGFFKIESQQGIWGSDSVRMNGLHVR